jgi:heparin binding hemagglutinin HbhA
MTITDDIVKSLRNPNPLYAVAGTADLAAEKLREVPALLEKLKERAPERIEKIRATDPKGVQQRVTAQAKDASAKAQTKLNETIGGIDLDLKKIGGSVQDLALQGVGRAAEYAVKARETYDGLALRGKGAVAQWRGEAADEVVEIAAAVEPDSRPDAASDAKPAAVKKPAARKPAAGTKKPADKPADETADKTADETAE